MCFLLIVNQLFFPTFMVQWNQFRRRIELLVQERGHQHMLLVVAHTLRIVKLIANHTHDDTISVFFSLANGIHDKKPPEYPTFTVGSLTRSSFDLESDPATVTVEAGYSKRRRRDTIPLHPAVASRVCEWLVESPARNGSLLFPVAKKKTSKMMRLDLERAGVPYVDAEGRVADFHANRHTFITNLCRAGVAPKVAQSLARHSTITLTMDVYSHADSGERIAAVRSLLAPG